MRPAFVAGAFQLTLATLLSVDRIESAFCTSPQDRPYQEMRRYVLLERDPAWTHAPPPREPAQPAVAVPAEPVQ